LSAADSACGAAKEAGRNRVHSFEENDIDLMRRRREMQWAARINNALEESRFELFRMPIQPLQGIELRQAQIAHRRRIEQARGRHGQHRDDAQRQRRQPEQPGAPVHASVLQRRGDVLERNGGRIGRQQRPRPGLCLDGGEQRALGVAVLEDRLDDDVGTGDAVAGDVRDQPVGRVARPAAQRGIPCAEGCDRALEHAVITAEGARDPELLRRLDAVAGRVLRAR